MIVVQFAKFSALYPHIVISSLIKRLDNLPFAILYTSFVVWPRDHYMSLQRLTLEHKYYFAIGLPLLDITQYPQASFAIADVSPYWI
jgi:hypothetical protein